MLKPIWASALIKRCPICRRDFAYQETECPNCGRRLVSIQVRVPAQES